MPLVDGFFLFRGFPAYPALSFRRCSIVTSFTLIGSKDSLIKIFHDCNTLKKKLSSPLQAIVKMHLIRPPSSIIHFLSSPIQETPDSGPLTEYAYGTQRPVSRAQRSQSDNGRAPRHARHSGFAPCAGGSRPARGEFRHPRGTLALTHFPRASSAHKINRSPPPPPVILTQPSVPTVPSAESIAAGLAESTASSHDSRSFFMPLCLISLVARARRIPPLIRPCPEDLSGGRGYRYAVPYGSTQPVGSSMPFLWNSHLCRAQFLKTAAVECDVAERENILILKCGFIDRLLSEKETARRNSRETLAHSLFCSRNDVVYQEEYSETGAAVAERLDCSPPIKANRVQSPTGLLPDFASGDHAGRCRWSVGFLGDLPFTLPQHSSAAPRSHLISPLPALKTSLLRAVHTSQLNSVSRANVLFYLDYLVRLFFGQKEGDNSNNMEEMKQITLGHKEPVNLPGGREQAGRVHSKPIRQHLNNTRAVVTSPPPPNVDPGLNLGGHLPQAFAAWVKHGGRRRTPMSFLAVR
ncbi:hypothetical protein PR048_002882 [Dryococelus australis]|uniref:Uncharacterized protein n=1 Tax=Dryococelus australis TaxID=614101 RepID=A0ABQ9IMZ1_9NEOP|nr:hypothetical protein PR048_002882 [Dryococelus australis]